MSAALDPLSAYLTEILKAEHQRSAVQIGDVDLRGEH